MQTQPAHSNLGQRTVGELVAEDYRKAEVFKRYGIDFCCGGGRTVEVACQKKGVSLSTLEHELREIEQNVTGTESPNATTWDLGFLADYIVNVHHAYVGTNIPLLREFTTKVARVHGHANPEVVQIASLFDALADELEQHMMKEEHILFPYIRDLTDAQRQNEPANLPPFGTVGNPIRMMEHEHDEAGTMMKEIRRLSNDFTPPDHACTTYRVLYFKLEEFEMDLHRHIHLENNILFPRAIALEQDLANRTMTEA